MTRISVGLQIPLFPPLQLSRSLLLFARLARLDSVLVPDHFQSFAPTALWDRDLSWAAGRFASPHEVFEYQVLMGYLASRAGRLRLGVGVTEPVRRHPVLIAQTMLTLAHAVRRRPILGIGAGERENIEPYGFDFSAPVERLEEALKIIRLCLAQPSARSSPPEPLNFRGRHFQLDGAVMALRPPKGRVPDIWIAAHGPRMLQLVGQYGDGWYPTAVASPEAYAAGLVAIRTAAQEAGRDPRAITPALLQFILVAPTERQAQAMLDTKLVRFATLISAPASEWRKVGAAHPFGDRYRGYIDFVPERYDRRTLERALAAVPPDLAGFGLIWGTPEQIADKLRAFGASGLRHVVLSIGSSAFSRGMALYGLLATRKIARLLRS